MLFHSINDLLFKFKNLIMQEVCKIRAKSTNKGIGRLKIVWTLKNPIGRLKIDWTLINRLDAEKSIGRLEIDWTLKVKLSHWFLTLYFVIMILASKNTIIRKQKF